MNRNGQPLGQGLGHGLVRDSSQDPLSNSVQGLAHSQMGQSLLHMRREIEMADGTRRWYLVSVPGQPAPPYPLVIDLHGFSEGATFHADASGLSTYGLTHGFMTAVPDGSLGGSVDDLPQWASTVEHNPDVAFIEAIMDDLLASWPVDPARIYVVGMSNGALLTAVLTYHLAHRIAATAMVAAARLPQVLTPARAVPLVVLHGLDDPIVPFHGGPLRTDLFRDDSDLRPVHCSECEDLRAIDPGRTPEALHDWATRNGATQSATRREAGMDVIEWHREGVETYKLYVIEKQGHSWPGSTAYRGLESLLGPSREHVPTNELIWKFLAQHRLPDQLHVGY